MVHKQDFCIILILTTCSFLHSVFATNSEAGFTGYTPADAFSASFSSRVQTSEALTRVFEVPSDLEQTVEAFYVTCYDASVRVGITSPDSIARTVSDAVRYTFGRLDSAGFVRAMGNTMSVYLLSQDVMTLENAESLSLSFSSAIEKRVFEHGDAIRALSEGIVDFASSLGAYPPDRAPALSIYFAKKLYSLSGLREPTSICSYKTRTYSANCAFGLTDFTANFHKFVTASRSVTKIFNIIRPAKILSDAWHIVMYNESMESAASYPSALARIFSLAVELTFDRISSVTYTETVGEFYALLLLSQGVLNKNNQETLARNLTLTIESKAKNVRPGDDVKLFLYALANGIEDFSASFGQFIFSPVKLGALVYYFSNELYSRTGVREPDFLNYP